MSEWRTAAETARRIATEAGGLVRNLQAGARGREKGGDQGIVTDADLAAEKLIVDRLRAAFPRDAILAEETSTDLDPDAERIWCVDPIDGTREYAAGLDEYAVHIGLLVDRRPVAGAVVLPAAGRCFWAWEGGAPRCGDEVVTVPAVADLGATTLIHSGGRRSDKLERAIADLGVASRRAAGSVGYKVARVLDGLAGLYLHTGRGTSWWDTVAPAAVLLAAGGTVTDARGEALDYTAGLRHRTGLLFAAPGVLELARARWR